MDEIHEMVFGFRIQLRFFFGNTVCTEFDFWPKCKGFLKVISLIPVRFLKLSMQSVCCTGCQGFNNTDTKQKTYNPVYFVVPSPVSDL